MNRRILLVNPPVYDFSAHDFWLKPYGLLEVAGFLRGKAELRLFDYMDRLHPDVLMDGDSDSDLWGRGKYRSEIVKKPAVFSAIPRYFRRFGLARERFQQFLQERGPFDFALVQTVMTYWYPGVEEVIRDLRDLSPGTRIVLGGIYATVCPAHAASLGPDVVIKGAALDGLWELMGLTPDLDQPPYWEGYPRLTAGVLRLSDGCPFHCNYCCVPEAYGGFSPRSSGRCIRELELLRERGVRNVAFYDDSLLYEPEQTLVPFLQAAADKMPDVNLHTPNAVHARLVTPDIAELMVRAGVRMFYLGLESVSGDWQAQAGGKVDAADVARAVCNLVSAGVEKRNVTTYVIAGHPDVKVQRLEETIRFAHDLGVRVMLSEYSPVPGTPDGERCRSLVELDEPLTHNKTAFTIGFLGWERIQALKALCRQLNGRMDV